MSDFNADFYKLFCKRIGIFACRALNHAFISGSLSLTQTQGIITCTLKGDKYRKHLKIKTLIALKLAVTEN